MNFSLTDEQRMLQEALARYLREQFDFEQRQAALAMPQGWQPKLWQDLADMGLLGLLLDEAQGGLGGSTVDLMLVMQELGQALALAPFVSTAVIGAGLLQQADPAQAEPLLAALVGGTLRTALAHGEPQARYQLSDVRSTATPDGEGWRLNGHKCVVHDAPWATHLIVSARSSGQPRDAQGVSLFLLDKNTPGLRLLDYPTVDGGQASELWLDEVRVPAQALIGPAGGGLPLLEQVLAQATVALCAEGVGVLQRLLADTLDYARQRHQFGVPIGSFQVLQHRMVDMHIEVEQASALTHVAAQRLAAPESDARQRALAASAAKARLVRAAQFVGEAAVQIHGGMGLSEALPLGHLFKRATVLGQLLGSADHHLRRYGQLRRQIQTGPEQASATESGDTPQEAAFRAEVRAWIAEAFDDELSTLMAQSKNGYLDKAGQQLWQKRLHAKGWAAPNWPVAHGGPDWTPAQRHIFDAELAQADCPRVSPMGLKMVAPVIMRFGTPEQQQRFLPPTLASDIFWCQGYSEPGSGSDLASLQTRAERGSDAEGEHYIVNGSKIWTTQAQWADWMFCLVRTSREGRPQAGISFLLIDMRSPGIRVVPIPLLDGPHPGEQEVNEVFFDNVRVPVANRIGDEGQGWTCAKYLLEFERGGAFGPTLRKELNKVWRIATEQPADDGAPLAQDVDFERKLLEMDIHIASVEAVEQRLFSGLQSGQSVGAASSMLKLVGTETLQAISALAVEAAGPWAWPFVRDTWAELRQRPAAPRAGPDWAAPLAPRYFNGRKASIYGGSNEIQRNILAKLVLGL